MYQKVGDMWAVISEHVPGRTDAQCRRRWKVPQRLHESPLVRSETGSPLVADEDRLLGELHNAYVDAGETGRADRKSHHLLQTPMTQRRHRRRWTLEEDRILIELHGKQGNAWAAISASITGRSGRDCYKRWVNVLDPAVKKGWWTVQEDRLLQELDEEQGDNWAEISARIPGRTGEGMGQPRKLIAEEGDEDHREGSPGDQEGPVYPRRGSSSEGAAICAR